ncbi:hypothetical protein FACS189475_08300 [Betaproteobacteria bacterium]|nr:hypothetical protein FACS189475_08300 [Betaproteobacteria bacterium]
MAFFFAQSKAEIFKWCQTLKRVNAEQNNQYEKCYRALQNMISECVYLLGFIKENGLLEKLNIDELKKYQKDFYKSVNIDREIRTKNLEYLLEVAKESDRSARASKIAKKPRKRSITATGGRALVEKTRTESKKRTWNAAWEWLCRQAENHINVGYFALESVDDDREIVHYWNKKEGQIKKTSFQKYWMKKKNT